MVYVELYFKLVLWLERENDEEEFVVIEFLELIEFCCDCLFVF